MDAELFRLPPELWAYIFGFISSWDLMDVRGVCRDWSVLIRSLLCQRSPADHALYWPPATYQGNAPIGLPHELRMRVHAADPVLHTLYPEVYRRDDLNGYDYEWRDPVTGMRLEKHATDELWNAYPGEGRFFTFRASWKITGGILDTGVRFLGRATEGWPSLMFVEAPILAAAKKAEAAAKKS